MVPTDQGAKLCDFYLMVSLNWRTGQVNLLHPLQQMDLRLKGNTNFMVPMEEGGKSLCLLTDGSIELAHRTSESVASAATNGLKTQG